MKFHYVYRISNTVLKKHYYGVRTSSVSPYNDIGISYFSSSLDREFRKDQTINYKDYRYKVVAVCDSREQAVSLEIKLHNKFSVGTNESFYNRAKQTSIGFDTTGNTWTLSKETKTKMSLAKKGKGFSKKHIENLSKTKIGRFFSTETREKIGNSSSYRNSGKGNPKAKLIKIYDAHNILKFECHGSFTQVCKQNGLPMGALYTSYHNEGKCIYSSNNSKSVAISKGFGDYIGWSAIEEVCH